MTTTAKPFSRLRSIFWPVHRHEFKKFFPMFLIYALIVFNYTILRIAKDALIVTATKSSAATIPYIKLWAILPMAFLSTLIFTRLSNKFSREKIFYMLMSTFIIFFLVFGFILYPLQNSIHPHGLADKLQSMLPAGTYGLVAIFRNWSFSLFYIMSELWSTIIMSVLFWGFVNEVTNVGEAKRFYAILSLGANIGTIVAGQAGILFSSKMLHSKIYFGLDRWGQTLMLITGVVFILGLIIIGLYRWLSVNVFSETTDNKEESKEAPKEKITMGIRKNFAYLAKSKYLICIALIVFSYNISLNLMEVIWKDKVHKLFPYPADYHAYMGQVSTYIGIVSTIFSLFLCGQLIRKFKWTFSAYITPIIVLVTGALFFYFSLFENASFVCTSAAMLGMSPIILCTFFGSMQNCFSRASKFTFFDITKEIAFIPLSNECKLKGKAAIDGVGSRIGKSGGSVVYHILFIFISSSISVCTSYIAAIMLVVMLAWIFSVKALGQQFAQLSENQQITPEPKTSEGGKEPVKVTT